MKWFLITLALGLAASDKLDRTYLPPPGAQFSGGTLGSHDAPLEPPYHTHTGPTIGGHAVSHPTFGTNGEPVNFGDKILKVPVTTTSYAFSQTTTYPPGEGFETTAFPINPVTGLPIQLGPENFPNGPLQGQQNIFNVPSITPTQAPTFGAIVQTGVGPYGPTAAPVNNGSPGYDQFSNQPLNQYPGQNVITPGGSNTSQTPGSVYPGQNQGQLQYPAGQANAEQQGLGPAGTPDNQRLDQYPEQNVVNPGGIIQIPGSNQGLVQYPGGQTLTGQQGVVPSTGSPITLQPGSSQYGVNYDGSQAQTPQGTYNGQPINVPNIAGTQPTQNSYQNQEPFNVGGIPSQYPNGNQNYGPSVPTESENTYRPGSIPSNIPSSYNNGVSSTTPFPGIPSATSSYPSIGPVYRPERPQATADRNAVILNYENVRTPNGYSYSFDTSNGIHADENGIVDNGTKAQGSYSYIGDDGKVYSVIYTADENGFQPRGDHLPTPPPIPEAIQRVIEQAARDKAAGIVHDGFYDEEKYGDHKYQGIVNHHRPQYQDEYQVGNGQSNGGKDSIIKPIVGIKDVEYDEGVEQDQFNNNLPVTGTTKDTNGKLPARRPSNQINGKNNGQDISEGNRGVSEDFDSPKGTFDGNSIPIVEEGIDQQNNFGTQKQGSSSGSDRPVSIGNNVSLNEANDSNQNNLTGSKRRGPSSRRPPSAGVKDVTEKYPGSNVDVTSGDLSETEGEEFGNDEGQNIGTASPNISDGSDENIHTNFDSVTSAPIYENKKQILRQRVKGNRGPGSTGNRRNQNKTGRPQVQTSTLGSTETPSFGDYVKNAIANQQGTQYDDSGYHYQQPNKKFDQNTFPTRFSPQEVSSTRKPDQRRPEYVEGTTLRPFMTPNVYDKNDRNSQSTPNGYNQNNRNTQSPTRRPFTTVGVTSPTDNSYTDYDDGEDYTTGDDRIDSNRYPAEKGDVTSRPYQPSQTTSRPQNAPDGQITRVNQKGTGTPGRRTENSGTVSPGYTYGPTTQMPSHNSRFGSTEIPRRMKPQQRRPSDTVPNSMTAIGNPVTTQSSSGTRPTDYNYQTTRPKTKYPTSNVGSGYPTTGSYPDFGSMSTTLGVSTPQNYYTSTYGPTQGYPSTTAIPSTYKNKQGPSTPGRFHPSQQQSFQTGYHYGPPKSGTVNLDGPGFFTPTGTSGVFPTSPTGTYKTTYQQGPGGLPSTTLDPITPGRQGNLITSQPGTAAPETVSTVTYQGNYQNGPSTPDYGTTIVSSTPGGKPIFKYPGSSGAQKTTGYEYGPTQPNYSTTNSPSTIGTTPGSFIPSGTNDPSQGYSTTYRPGFQTTKDSFVGGPVDGFGRPIVTDQGGSHPGFGHPTQGTTGPVTNFVPNFDTEQSTIFPGSYDQPRTEQAGSYPGFGQPTQGTPGSLNNLGSNIDRTDQSTTYPGSYDRTRVIGEDFSGPKQPQRYDPKTGYHYK